MHMIKQKLHSGIKKMRKTKTEDKIRVLNLIIRLVFLTTAFMSQKESSSFWFFKTR